MDTFGASASPALYPPGHLRGPIGGEWPTKLLVLLLFLALTLGMTFPLVLNLTTAIPGPPWDNFVWLYDLWWFRHSIVDLGEWPTVNPTVFVPSGYDLRLSETMLANKALIAPVLFWGDEVLAYNVLLILTFVLTGYTTYLLVDYLTDNLYAAVLGGAIFAFSPYRVHAMAAGWLPLLATQWIPLIFLYLERTLREDKWQYAIATGVCVALTLLSSWYYLYIVGSLAVLYLLVRLYPWKQGFTRPHLVRNLALIGAVAIVLVAPVALPVALNGSGEMGWPLTEVQKWAASADDAFLPNVYHPIWGERFLRLRAFTLRYPWYAPGFIYLGILSTVLALAGWIYGRRRFHVVRPMVWIGLVSLVLAMGVVLRWGNETVGVSVPPALEMLFTRSMSTLMSKLALNRASYYDLIPREGWQVGQVPIPLPGLLVYLFVPLGNAMRTLYRFGGMTILAVAVLAGIGTAGMLGGGRPAFDLLDAESRSNVAPDESSIVPRSRRASFGLLILTTLLLGLVLFDFVPAPLAFGFSEVEAQPLDLWLAARGDDAVIMQFPLVRGLSGDTLYRTKYHGKNVAYGHGTFYPERFQEAMPVLATFPNQDSLDLLQEWGVTHVVVGSGAYDAGWGDQPGQTWATLEAQIDASPQLVPAGIMNDKPFWRDERVSHVIQGSPPVIPILVDKTYLYELR